MQMDAPCPASLHTSAGSASLCDSIGTASLCDSMGTASLCDSMGTAPLCNSMGTALLHSCGHRGLQCTQRLLTSAVTPFRGASGVQQSRGFAPRVQT